MIILKSIILILIFGGSTSIGYIISKKYANRVKELKDFRNAINMLENKIKFTYEPIPEIFKEISKTLDNNISEIFSKSSEYIVNSTIKEGWNKAIEEKREQTSLNNEDISIIKNLGNMLGKTDIDGQISEIELTSNFIDTQVVKAEEERKKNEKLYRTLGTVVGLAVVIILI